MVLMASSSVLVYMMGSLYGGREREREVLGGDKFCRQAWMGVLPCWLVRINQCQDERTWATECPTSPRRRPKPDEHPRRNCPAVSPLVAT
jgi:hypothetical protein